MNQTATYTVAATANSCASGATVHTVTVKPKPTVSATPTSQNICSGQPMSTVAITNPNGVSGTTFSWTVSAPNITGAMSGNGASIAQTLTQATTTNQTATYTITPSANSCAGVQVTATVVVYRPLGAGTIGSAQTICSGSTPVGLTNTASAVGGTGTYAYQWEQSPNGTSWSNASGTATNATYAPPSLTATTLYRRKVTSCSTVQYATAIVVTVNSATAGGSVAAGVEAYGVASGSLTLSAHNGAVQKWQQKIGSDDWADLVNTTNSQAYTNVVTTTRYRAVVKSGVCPSANSSEASIIIHPVPTITVQGNAELAPGGSATIITNSNQFQYTWYRDEVAIQEPVLETLAVRKPGLYKVSVKTTATSPVYTTGNVAITSTLDNPHADMNFVRTTVFNAPGMTEATDLYTLTADQFALTTAYADGLGRPAQTVTLGAGGNGSDLIQAVEYDGFGREARQYLPYTHQARDGRYQPQTTALAAQAGFYSTTDNVVADDAAPYSLTVFEPSPLSRVVKQGAPGTAWQPDSDNSYASTDHTVKFAYEFNGENEVLLWTHTPAAGDAAFGTIDADAGAGFYEANQLQKSRTKDEQGHEVVEYKDKRGRVVFKRVQAEDAPAQLDNTTYAGTYYIYDDVDNLVCVLQPEGTRQLVTYFAADAAGKETFLQQWAFRYRYDHRRRTTLKQVPGADSLRMVYDKRDRLVLTQDGNQRSTHQWIFTKYDALNRPVMTGLYSHGSAATQEQMSALVSATQFAEVADAQQAHGYTTAIFPNTNLTVYAVTFYDHYNYSTPECVTCGFVSNHLPGQRTSHFTRVRGLVTGTKTNVLGTTDYLWTVTYYDDKLRAVQVVAQHHAGGTVRTTNRYSFARLEETKTTTTSAGGTIVNTRRWLKYDPAGRLAETWHTLNNQDSVLLVKNEYDELGQLMDKKLHSSDGNTFAQSIDYRYNIRGWLESINNSQLTIDNSNDDANDLFGMELGYTSTLGLPGTAQYNGNISAITWSNNTIESNVLQRAYSFDYDALNRLKAANHKQAILTGVWTDGFHHEKDLDYDLNGNILALTRNGDAGSEMDELTYGYAGNQLQYVHDTGDATKGFANGNTGTDDYAYDANGNMVLDKNKGITAIAYNYLNLPQQVKKGVNDYIAYRYNAAGIKISQQVVGATPKTTDYLGEVIVEDGAIQLINHEEGRLVAGAGGWEYQYHLKDHLGNVRTTFVASAAIDSATATLETANEATELATFLRVAEVRKVQSPLFDHTNGSAPSAATGYAQRLSGSAEERFGLARSLSVMAGDTIRAEVFAKYIDGASGNRTGALNTLLAQIAAGTAAAGTVVDGGSYSGSTASFPYGAEALANTEGSSESGPKAYLNWLVFKRDGTFVPSKSGYDRLSITPKEQGQDVAHERLYSPDIVITEPGFVYIYLSNEAATPVEVYFDDFSVTHVNSTPVVQSDDYYPFGLAFNSYRRESSLENKIRFQGQEHVDDLGLNWDSFKWRNHQPDIGRFFNIDPLAEKYVYNSTYAFSENCVTSHVELEGLEKISIQAAEFTANQRGRTVVADKQVVKDESTYNKNVAQSPNGGDSKRLSSDVETSDGSISNINTVETGDSGFEEFADFVTSGNLDNFSYSLTGTNTKEGSVLEGSVEDANFKTSISIADNVMTFATTMSGGDPDKAYALKVSATDTSSPFSIGVLKAGREEGSSASVSVSISFTTDKNGNAVFNSSEWIKLYEKDKQTTTKSQ